MITMQKRKVAQERKDEIAFRRQLLGKHVSLMELNERENNMREAGEHFATVKQLFGYLTGEGEKVSWYTPEDFERDHRKYVK